MPNITTSYLSIALVFFCWYEELNLAHSWTFNLKIYPLTMLFLNFCNVTKNHHFISKKKAKIFALYKIDCSEHEITKKARYFGRGVIRSTTTSFKKMKHTLETKRTNVSLSAILSRLTVLPPPLIFLYRWS